MRQRDLLLAVGLLLSAAFGLNAQEKPVKLESRAEIAPRAKFVDFSSQLGISVGSLSDLGDKIDQARLASDPVDLAMSAKLLEALEGVAGKQASLTSKSVSEEAVNLAKMRGNATEMLTVGKLIGGDAAEDLAAMAEQAKAREAEASESTRDLYGDLVVDSHWNKLLYIYVNGYAVGQVQPKGFQKFSVHKAAYLDAMDNEGHRWHKNINAQRNNFLWGIYPK